MPESTPPQLAIASTSHNPAPEEVVHTLQVGGDVVKLDALGPMIINSDGVSRMSPLGLFNAWSF
jgi:hypothetical protein